MKHSKGKYNMYGLLAVGIAVATYILVGFNPIKFDFTDNHIYTLSKETKEIVSNANEPLQITYFTSEEVPQSFVAVKESIEDLLQEYKEIDADVHVTIAFPQNGEDVYKQAKDNGIQPIRYNVVSSDSIEVTEGYSALMIEYEDKKEIVPRITSALNNEILITSSINSLTQEEKQPIDFLVDHNTSENTVLKQFLGKQYEINETTIDEIGNNKTLAIIEPKEEFSDEELQKIDSFVVSDGNLMVFHSKINVNEATLEHHVVNTKLDTLLSNYGITINTNLVGDFLSNEVLTYNDKGSKLQAQYPFWVRLSDGIQAENAIMSGILYVMAPWSSTLSIDSEKGNVEVLAQTSDRAYAFSNDEIQGVHPNDVYQPSLPSQDKHTIGAVASGEIQSAYSEEKSNYSSVVVFGASKMLSDNFLPSIPTNANLISNIVDITNNNQQLVSVRNKTVQSRPLISTKKERKTNIKFTSIALSITLAAGLGAIIALHRTLKYRQVKKQFTEN